MKSKIAGLLFLLGICLFHPCSASSKEKNRKLIVGSGDASCPGATFSHIQDAIAQAADGAEIRVCAGIYDEAISIRTSIHLMGDTGATIMPSHLLPNATSLTSGSQFSAILQVMDADEVTIEGVVFDAGAASITQCSPDLIGILFQNSSGTIKQNTVRNTKLGASLNGCQSGLGIFVQSGNGGTSEVVIAENHVTDYQKNGITADELGTIVTIRDNDVIGQGATTGAAQNGIQIGYGATGEISHNFVTGHIWSPCTSAGQCLYFATGILVEQSDHVSVEGNSVGNNQVNILINGRDAHVARNRVYGAVVLDGIQILGDDSSAEDNRIVNSTEAAISVYANNITVRDNIIINAPIGILQASSAIGLRRSNNRFVDVAKTFVDPEISELVAGRHDPVR